LIIIKKIKEMEETQAKHKVCASQITLRLLTVSDIDDFMVWSTDEKVSKCCTWEPFTSKNDAVLYIQTSILTHPWFRAICLDGRPIGAVMVTGNTGSDRCRAEIGYHLGSGFWGRGIVTEAVKMAALCVFKEWDYLERLEAFVEPDNGGSIRVLEKVGFLREGVLRKHYLLKGRARDFVIFSLLSNEVEA
jgi:RimJ/RimL family protein N-acetyltransferase